MKDVFKRSFILIFTFYILLFSLLRMNLIDNPNTTLNSIDRVLLVLMIFFIEMGAFLFASFVWIPDEFVIDLTEIEDVKKYCTFMARLMIYTVFAGILLVIDMLFIGTLYHGGFYIWFMTTDVVIFIVFVVALINYYNCRKYVWRIHNGR